MASLSVEVPEYVFSVSRLQKPLDWSKEPKWSPFQTTNRLELLDILKSSSVVGQSYAKVKLNCAKSPSDKEIQPEDANQVMWLGDRLAIGLRDSQTGVNWLFGGICTVGSINIGSRSESMVYKISGPEHAWGESPGSGAFYQIWSQFRRLAQADDQWKKDNSTITTYENWDRFTDLEAVFNQDGRKNMTSADVILTTTPAKKVMGRIWEESDRMINGTSAAQLWNLLDAAKMLCTYYNDYATTNIEIPENWSGDAVPFTRDEILPPTSVQGTGLYDALRRLCGSRYGFYVDPKPEKVSGSTWSGFRLVFFSRTQGPDADLRLNKRGTPILKAQASVVRLEGAKDVQKTISSVTARARLIRPILLGYFGGYSKSLPDDKKRIALQPDWLDADGKLSDYGANDVTEISIDTKGKKPEWQDRYVIGGKDFQKYANVFRRFSWNEGNELPTGDRQFGGSTSVGTIIPDLTGIADTPDFPGKYVRRRRPMLDTLYLRNSKIDEWSRIKPTLFMSRASGKSSDKFNDLNWARIPRGAYSIDPIRAAIAFTAEDLSRWQPFINLHTNESDPTQRKPQDPTTFATMLNDGTLRMCIDCSVAVDYALEAFAERGDGCGTPLIRERIIEARDFIKTLDPFRAGLISPLHVDIDESPIDQTTDAQTYAEFVRDAGQELQNHASVLTSGDWKEQPIGAMINQIKGSRTIEMRAPSGKGAQIVAVRLDPRTNKYEYLTESLAFALTARDKKMLEHKARVFKLGQQNPYDE